MSAPTSLSAPASRPRAWRRVCWWVAALCAALLLASCSLGSEDSATGGGDEGS